MVGDLFKFFLELSDLAGSVAIFGHLTEMENLVFDKVLPPNSPQSKRLVACEFAPTTLRSQIPPCLDVIMLRNFDFVTKTEALLSTFSALGCVRCSLWMANRRPARKADVVMVAR